MTSVPPAITIGENELGAISAEMPASALTELTESPSFLGRPVENPAAAALSGVEEPSRDDGPSSLATAASRSPSMPHGRLTVDQPQAGPALTGDAPGVSEYPLEDSLAPLDDKMGLSPTELRQADALTVNRAARERGVQEGLASGAEVAGAPSAPGSSAQSSVQPREVHSGIIREDDRVAFARSDSVAGPDRVSPSRMATISLASPAERGSEFYADDSASTPAAIPLADSGDGTLQLRLGDLIALLEDRMERPLFVWLSSAGSASKYVTFDTLRAAGIGVDYDPVHNHVVLSVAEEEGK